MYGRALRRKVCGYILHHPGRVLASVGTVFLGSHLMSFVAGRLLLKSRLQFGLFVPNGETYAHPTFKTTSASTKLQEIMSPEVSANSYYMVTGGRGVGKSTSAKYNADVLGHKGIVYVRVPENGSVKDFEDTLAKELFQYHLSYGGLGFLCKHGSCLFTLLKTLVVISKKYKRWHLGKSVVLVIDQMENFSKSKEEGMDYATILQDKANYFAVSKRLISC
jgi:nucleoside-triphosphatase THEP1